MMGHISLIIITYHHHLHHDHDPQVFLACIAAVLAQIYSVGAAAAVAADVECNVVCGSGADARQSISMERRFHTD